tara:strand:+ start:470 stop:847 length:378 start_codon:yes stop_codon:yes gene_type:complete
MNLDLLAQRLVHTRAMLVLDDHERIHDNADKRVYAVLDWGYDNRNRVMLVLQEYFSHDNGVINLPLPYAPVSRPLLELIPTQVINQYNRVWNFATRDNPQGVGQTRRKKRSKSIRKRHSRKRQKR